MKSTRQTLRLNAPVRYAIIALALLLGACGALPQQNEPRQNDPGYEPSVASVAGIVNYVDTANSEIEITTERNSGNAGRTAHWAALQQPHHGGIRGQHLSPTGS